MKNGEKNKSVILRETWNNLIYIAWNSQVENEFTTPHLPAQSNLAQVQMGPVVSMLVWAVSGIIAGNFGDIIVSLLKDEEGWNGADCVQYCSKKSQLGLNNMVIIV